MLKFFGVFVIILTNPLGYCVDTKNIWVVDHGWHTGVVFPYDKNFKNLLDKDFSKTSYLEFGWGEQSYYPDPNPSIFVGLKALFWPSDSLLHVAGYDINPDNVFAKEDLFLIKMDDKSYLKMVSYIRESFVLNKDNLPVLFAKGIYSRKSYFYKAKGNFHLFRTCNTWTAKAFFQSGKCQSNKFLDSFLLDAEDIKLRCAKK
jgi:uncharacterized protein (TIGR02117 family)